MSKKVYLFGIVIAAILLSLSLNSAQSGNYDYEDSTFVPVSSEECTGDKTNGCVIAVFAGKLISMNDPRLGTNKTEIIDKLKQYSNYSKDPNDPADDGATLNETIDATTTIWGDGNLGAGRTLDKISITNVTDRPPPKDETYVQNGVRINDHSGQYPTADDIATAISTGRKCGLGFVHYDYSKTPWEVIWAHYIRIVAIDASGTEWTDVNGVDHKRTRVQIYDPYHNVVVDTHMEEVGNGQNPDYVYIYVWGQWNLLEDAACIYKAKSDKGPKSPGTGVGTNPPAGSGGKTSSGTQVNFQCSAGDPNFDQNNPSNVCSDDCPGTDYCDLASCKCLPLPTCGQWVTEEDGSDPGTGGKQVCQPNDKDCPPGRTCNDTTCQCE